MIHKFNSLEDFELKIDGFSPLLAVIEAESIHGHVYNAKNSCLFEPPGPDAPTKLQGQKLADRRSRFPDSMFMPEGTKEVQ